MQNYFEFPVSGKIT